MKKYSQKKKKGPTGPAPEGKSTRRESLLVTPPLPPIPPGKSKQKGASSKNDGEIEVAKLDQKLHKMRRESSTLNDKGVLPSISSNPPKKGATKSPLESLRDSVPTSIKMKSKVPDLSSKKKIDDGLKSSVPSALSPDEPQRVHETVKEFKSEVPVAPPPPPLPTSILKAELQEQLSRKTESKKLKKKGKSGKTFLGKRKDIGVKSGSEEEFGDFEPLPPPVPSDPEKGSVPKAPLLTHLFVLPPTEDEVPLAEDYPQMEIEVQGYGYEDEEKKGYISIDGHKITTIEPEGFTRAPSPLEYSHLNVTPWERTPEAKDLGRDSVDRGIYLVTLSRRRIDKHLFRVERTRFDTFRSKDVAQALSRYISRLEENTIIIGTTADEPSKNLAEFKTALSDLGIATDLLAKEMYRGSFVFIALKGQRERTTMKIRKRKQGPCYLAHTLVYGEVPDFPEWLGGPWTPNPKELQQGKKMLRKTDFSAATKYDNKAFKQSLKTIVNRLSKIFSWNQHFSHMKDQEPMEIMTGKGDETLLNLAYLDNVSDMALIVLAKKFSSNITKHMKGVLRAVNLSACRLITDRGLKYMQPLIEISKEVNLLGCPHVTELSFHPLLKDSDIDAAKLGGTDVCLLSPDLKTESALGAVTTYRASDTPEIYKTVIIHGAGVKTSLLKLLETGKVEHRATIVGTLQLKDEGTTIHNIIECDENTSDYFLSARTLYVLPYNADTPEDMTKTCLKLLALIIKILGKVFDAEIMIVGVSSSTKQPTDNVQATLMEMRHTTIKTLKNQTEKFLKKLDNFDMSMPDDAAAVDLATQERMAQIYHLQESLHNYREEVPVCINLADSSAASTLLNSLKNSVTEFPKKWPMYDKISTKIMTQVGSFNMPGGFYTRTEILNDDPTFNPTLLKLLHIMGKVAFVNEFVVTDLEWLNRVYQTLLDIPPTMSRSSEDHLTIVKSGCAAWDRDVLLSLKVFEKKEVLESLLEASHFFMEYEDRPNNIDVVIPYNELPSKPPTSLKSFLAVEALEHCRSLKVTFKLACNVTPSVLAALHYNIMRTSVIPDRLIMLWKTGMVVNFMDQEIIYQVNLNDAAKPKLELQLYKYEEMNRTVNNQTNGEKDIIDATKEMKGVMALFTVPVAYTLQQHRVPHEVEISGERVAENKMASGTEKTGKEDYFGDLQNYVVTNHDFDMILSVCKNCRTYRNMYTLLWDMFKKLYPTSTSSLIPVSTESRETHGNLVELNPSKQVHLNTNLNPYNNNTISATIMGDSTVDLVVGIECKIKHRSSRNIILDLASGQATDGKNVQDAQFLRAQLKEGSEVKLSVHVQKQESERTTLYDEEEENRLIFKTSATCGSLQGGDIHLMDADGFQTNSTIRIIMNDTGIPFVEPLGADDPSSEATGNYLLVRNINDYKDVWCRHGFEGQRQYSTSLHQPNNGQIEFEYDSLLQDPNFYTAVTLDQLLEIELYGIPTKKKQSGGLNLIFESLGHEIIFPLSGSVTSLRPFFGSTKQARGIVIDNQKAPSQNRQSAEWMKGMKVEAWDRKTPSLVCVATIADVDDETGDLVVHFDGWTSRYDYHCDSTSVDIHPIGWFQHYIENESVRSKKKNSDGKVAKYSMELQKPKGYGKTFNWDQYLIEENAIPAPHQLFTEEQTDGCPEYNYSQETVASKHLFPTVQKIKCTATAGKGLVLSDSGKPLITKMVRDQHRQLMVDGLRNGCVVLPTKLNMTLLKYPSITKVLPLSELEIMPMCTYGRIALPDKEKEKEKTDKTGYLSDDDITVFSGWHLVNESNMGSPFEQCDATVQSEAANNTLLLAYSKCIAPDSLNSLIEGFDTVKMNMNQFTWQLRKLLIVLASHVMSISGEKKREGVPEADLLALGRKKIYEKISEKMSKTLVIPDNDKAPIVCRAHVAAKSPNKDLGEVPMDMFAGHYGLITNVILEFNSIQQLPVDLFMVLKNLKNLNLKGNQITELPSGIGKCKELKHLQLEYNQISQLNDDIGNVQSLSSLNLSHNPLERLGEAVFECKNLQRLLLRNTGLTEVSEQLGNLVNLMELDVSENALSSLPESLAKLENLQFLHLAGIQWFVEGYENKQSVLTRETFDTAMDKCIVTRKFDSETRDELFGTGDGGESILEYKGIQTLNAKVYKELPRLRASRPPADEETDDYTGGVPPQVLKLKNLELLDLSWQGIVKITKHIAELSKLQVLKLGYNPQLESLDGQIGALPLKADQLDLHYCVSMKTPPKEIVGRGFKAVMGYLKRLLLGSVSCKRTKLMMVGLGGAGKTSLVRALTSEYYQSHGTQGEKITDGIDITTWNVKRNDENIVFSVWDFAGQTVYYNTHQFFLSNRAVYFLLWNIRLGWEHAGLDFWLSSIACHAPKAPILVVGSHRDQVEKFTLPVEELQKRYPQIAGFHYVSSFTGDGVKSLADHLMEVALQEKYMGEKIPEAWLKFETKILAERKTSNLLPFEAVETFATECGVYDKSEVNEAVSFLHSLGSLQHFASDALKSKVVINPQWIVDVMACVVSVRSNAIEDGRLLHTMIPQIWGNYPTDLHPWLLRLTEEFDLTFPLHDQKCNVVPCLLPEKEPEYDWPDISDHPTMRETKIEYKFDYLPAGLFNRGQVRLYQFSDSSVIWKKGSLLKKNGHLALLLVKDREVLVRVQGTRPENIQFLVHEVFESLIAESFHGVTYDFLLPCNDCLKVGTMDPCMFAASKIRRATELKAPFLQCDKYFHTLSLTELHAIMPPDSSADFDVHLERSLRDLKDLREDLSCDVFMFYDKRDVPNANQEHKKISPRKIYLDLQEREYKCWFPENPNEVDLQQMYVTMRDAKVVIVFISKHFLSNSHCCDVFYYAHNSLQKKIKPILLDDDMSWMKTDIGMQLSGEVFIKMNDVKRYLHKIKEVYEAVDVATGSKSKTIEKSPECFISYCWSNSHEAVKKGTKSTPESLGWADPRDLKKHLEKNGVKCWMDIERIGQGGLFEDIADGLRRAKLMVACVSDEYAKSKNCVMELRFATVSLKIPVIVAVVGTGFKWEATEAGMLCLGTPKINFQYESPQTLDRLADLVRKYLPEEQENESEKEEEGQETEQSHNAFQELLELAQRKFLRQVAGYSSGDAGSFPRIILIDFFTDEEIRQQETARKYMTRLQENIKDLDEPCESQTDDKESGHGESPTKKESKTNSEERGDTNLEANNDVHPHFENVESYDGPGSEFCVRLMCEHEQGWHTYGPGMALRNGEGQRNFTAEDIATLTEVYAPYGARLMAILRHTTQNLPCLNTERGEQLRQRLEQKCSLEPEFKHEYGMLKKCAVISDTAKTLGSLARCHLPSGKVVWICPDHQKADRVTVLATGDVVEGEFAEDDDFFISQIVEETQSDRPKTASGPRTAGRQLSKRKSQAKLALPGEGNDNTKVRPRLPQAGPAVEGPTSQACCIQ